MKLAGRLHRPTVNRILVLSLLCLAMLFAFRVDLRYHQVVNAVGEAELLLAFAGGVTRFGSDAAWVLLLTGLALFLSAFAGRRTALPLHFLAMLFTAAMGAVNMRIAALYGQPLSPALLAFSGIRDMQSAQVIAAYAETKDAIAILLVLAGFAITAFILALRRFERWLSSTAMLALGLAGIFGAATTIALPNADDGLPRHRNAVWWYLAVALTQQHAPQRDKASDPAAPFRRFASREAPVTTQERIASAGIRNVLIVVLESVGEEYLHGDNLARRMPELARWQPHSVRFHSAYAHAPSSFVMLYTLLAGRYPQFEPSGIPESNVTKHLPTLLSTLSRQGYRTGGFFASSWAAGGYADFAIDQGMHVADGAKQPECLRQRQASPGDEGLDACVYAAARRWLGNEKQPFMLLMWNDQTHYPYIVPGGSRSGAQADYFASIRLIDRHIGDLMQELDRRGTLDETLVVVVGDHGEAFGQHGRNGHGADVHEESVRVPLILINRRLFHGSQREDVVGVIDVAPTILAALRVPTETRWQGVNLLGNEIREKTYMASPWGGFLGVRTQSARYSADVAGGRLETEPFRRGDKIVATPQPTPAEASAVISDMWNWVAAMDAQVRQLERKAPPSR